MATQPVTHNPLAAFFAPSYQAAVSVEVQQGVEALYQTLAANLPTFEPRAEQRALTERVAEAIHSKTHLVAEAPTGTGKSFALALGAFSQVKGTTKKVVIATANNNLLEQYATKDFPFLQSIFPEFSWARAKGKNNFVCIDKAEDAYSQSLLINNAGDGQLRQWYDALDHNGGTGDKDGIPFAFNAKDWGKINADDNCTGKSCRFYKECHYYKAKERTLNAQIIITNFDIVLLDLLRPNAGLLPPYDVLMLDEAHGLEEKAIDKLQKEVTKNSMIKSMATAQGRFGVDNHHLTGISADILGYFNHFEPLVGRNGDDRFMVEVVTPAITAKTNAFIAASANLRALILNHKTTPYTREAKAQRNLIERLRDAEIAVRNVMQPFARDVAWVEREGRDNMKVVVAPYRVAVPLKKMLFDTPDLTCITMSATLTMPGKSGKPDFTQYRKRVGITKATEFVCPSPFNYRKNCVLYLPTPPAGCSDPNQPLWRQWMIDETLALLKMSQGHALILTTSNKGLKDIGEALTRQCQYPVKIQTPGGSNSQLVQWLKDTPNGVLVGTASFWEGVSVEGSALRLVIIDKIPFTPHTDPIQKAREAWYRADELRKKRVFMELSMYPAVMKLKQGFGRLIRTKTDRGAVAILDPRLTGSRYGNTLLKSLPDATRVTSRDDVRLIEILK